MLEVGAGVSLPSLLVGQLGTELVVSTDIEDTTELIQENIERNALENEVKSFVLDWLEEDNLNQLIKTYGNDYNYILSADCVYSIDAVLPFIHVLDTLANEHTKILFAHPKARIPEASDLFWKTIVDKFEVEKVPKQQFAPDSVGFNDEHNGVFILTKKKQKLKTETNEPFDEFLEIFYTCCGMR